MFCSNCGTKAPEGSVFCEQCGHRLGEMASSGSRESPASTSISTTPRRGIVPYVAVVAILALAAAAAWATIGGNLKLGASPTTVGLASQATATAPTSRTPEVPNESGATPIAVVQASPTPVPTAIPSAPSPTVPAPTSTPETKPTSTPSLASPSSTPIPQRSDSLPTPRPRAKASPIATTSPDQVDGVVPFQVLADTGISLTPPEGWTYVESTGSPGEGSFTFYAEAGEQSKGLFTSSGAFTVETWKLSPDSEVPPEDVVNGFIDAQFTAYASTLGGEATFGEYELAPIENYRYAGWTTTFDISGDKGTYRYAWADLRVPERIVVVICESAPENWDAISAACQEAYWSVDIQP